METSVLKESGALILIQGRPFRFLQHINGDVDTLTWLRLTMMTTLRNKTQNSGAAARKPFCESSPQGIPKSIAFPSDYLSNLKYKTTQNYAHSGDPKLQYPI